MVRTRILLRAARAVAARAWGTGTVLTPLESGAEKVKKPHSVLLSKNSTDSFFLLLVSPLPIGAVCRSTGPRCLQVE